MTNSSIIGFSSITSNEGWLLKIVSKSVVPDLGKPIRKIGFFSLVFNLGIG